MYVAWPVWAFVVGIFTALAVEHYDKTVDKKMLRQIIISIVLAIFVPAVFTLVWHVGEDALLPTLIVRGVIDCWIGYAFGLAIAFILQWIVEKKSPGP